MANDCSCCSTDPAVLAKVAAIAAPWKGREDMLLEVLKQAQAIAGNAVPEDVAAVIAKEMNVPKAKVFGVLSFYAFFSIEKRGENIIRMCKSAPCHVTGAAETLQALEQALGIPVGGTTADGKFTLETCECLGICDLAPAIMVNDEVFGPVWAGDVKDFIAKF